jgi:hypothetical protein
VNGSKEKRKGALNESPFFSSSRTGKSSTSERYDNYVPLDGFRAEIIQLNTVEILDNDLLNFGRSVNEDTGEVIERFAADGTKLQPKRIAFYKGLTFQYFLESKRLILSGSFHKYYNDGRHNHNQFPFAAFTEVLSCLDNEFNIRPLNIQLISLEWGYNLNLDLDTLDVIEGLIEHKNTPFKFRNIQGSEIKVAEHSAYRLKIYDKALQYGQRVQILRIERAQKHWFRLGVGRTLQDLIDQDFGNLKELLIQNWNEIIFFDPLIVFDKELEKYRKYQSTLYWIELGRTRSRKTKKKHRGYLANLNIEYGGNIQGRISELLSDLNVSMD